MVRRNKPPSQSWRTFLGNRAQQLVSVRAVALAPSLAEAHNALAMASLGLTRHKQLRGYLVIEPVSLVRLVMNLCIIGAFREAQDHGKGT